MELSNVEAGRARTHRIVIVTALLGCVGGIVALGLRRWQRMVPNLSEVRALARVGKFGEAQDRLRPYLRARPGDSEAHLLMAELATEPPSPTPDEALEHLRAVRPTSPEQAAVVKFYEGKAQYQRARYDLAEDCWREALQLDPLVAGAGWALMDLIDKEGRVEEAHRLGMHLHEIEPDPVDRVRILLELSRMDIEKVAPGSQVQLFEPLVRSGTKSLPLALVVGLALVRENRVDEGLELLRNARRRDPDSPEVWDAWLTGLYEASEFDLFRDGLARLPRKLAKEPRFAKHQGYLAQNDRDWSRAVQLYRRALEFDPSDQAILYRLWFVTRRTGDAKEIAQIDEKYRTYRETYRQLRGTTLELGSTARPSDPSSEEFGKKRGVYYEAVLLPGLGTRPNPDLYHRLADLRERMGRRDEARAWHRLVLRDNPRDSVSLAALKRLD
jgi:tetratricopeptide (TPR) repeat protein